MRHSVSREEVMERKQHHTPAEPLLSRGGADPMIGIQGRVYKGGNEFETLWRILLHQSQRDADEGYR